MSVHIAPRRRMLDVLVVGAGQAGLAMGRELERAGADHLIIDGAKAIGDSWRRRWDSLRLFTPAEFSSLRGLPFPAPAGYLPSKNEVADYLQAYATAFSMPIALDEPVRSVTQNGPFDFVAETDYARYRARHIVVAAGAFQKPSIPPLSALIAPNVVQLHSSEYRNPSQLPDGPVLVVGGGASGIQIAQEIAASHPVSLAVGSSPLTLPTRVAGRSVFSWLDRIGFFDVTAHSFLGRRVRSHDTVIGVSARVAAKRHGVRVTSRIVAVEHGMPCTTDGNRLEVSAIIWSTGFRSDYPWLHVPVFDAAGRPGHHRGVTRVPGLSFIGLPWQHTRGSALLGWVARDAEFLAHYILASLPSFANRSANVRRRIAS